MPMYEYQCSKCEKRFEELVRNQEEEADVACPECESTKVFKVMSAFSKGACKGSPLGQGPGPAGGSCPHGGGGGFS